MSRKQIPIIAGAAILLLVLVLLLFGSSGKYVSWWEHYRPDSKDPYGTYLVRNLLETYHPGQDFEVLEDSLGGKLDSGSFVFIGSYFFIDSAGLDELLRFVERGNRALIAAPYIPEQLLDSLGQGQCLNSSTYEDSIYLTETKFYLEDTLATLNFQHPGLQDEKGYPYRFLFFNAPQNYEWNYLPPRFFCDYQAVFASLGQINGEHTNFAKATCGRGEFYLHTTPLAFTNLHLIGERGLDYAGKVFSHLPAGKIYWDEREPGLANPSGSARQPSPLKYILSQPPLAWVWYLLLGLAVLYLIFRAKRRQRVIPVLEHNSNTSLEFIGTIGRLFFIQNNHKQLAQQKMRLFLNFVRERYHVPTKELNEAFAKNLATRSDVPEDVVSRILLLHRNIDNSGFLSENTLVDFHRQVERFYRECK
ncbi:MAG: DUF4350 domain-containing protein [Bacteroidetes bacterium]|nr:DUF4350 domain-containing protein [Bacteroidota bacterium]